MTLIFIVRRSALSLLVPCALLVAFGLLSGGSPRGTPVLPTNSVIREGNPARCEVALMFNVDWGEESLPSIFSTLAAKNVRVTFFVTGRWARSNPDLVIQMAAKGHEVASHGNLHALPTKLGDADLDNLISGGIATLTTILGGEPAPLFAPPSGDCDARVARAAERLGCKTILWTIDTVDWKRPPARSIADRALGKARAGTLILMHPTTPTAEALPKIIDGLRQRGLEPVTVSKAIKP